MPLPCFHACTLDTRPHALEFNQIDMVDIDLLEKKHDPSINRGFIDEHLGAVASTIPVKKLIKNGTPYPMASPIRYRRSVLLLPLKKIIIYGFRKYVDSFVHL